MSKKIEQIGGEKTFTYVVDPNPSGREYVNPEDLTCYVSLRAYPKSRSVIADNNTFNNFTEREVVEFITSTEQNGEKYVTTNYLNIGGNRRQDESFGIKDINIKYGAKLVPEVNITFIDARGASVFNGYEYEDENGLIFNSSTFSSFFKLPYPLYELTVKGFYGNAVTYCLHLTKFSSRFNPDTGNFEITTNFIGYTHAFLADVLMQYVLAISNSDIGSSKLEEDDLISLNELLQSFGRVTRLTETFKDSSEEYEKLKTLNSLVNKLQVIQAKIGNPLNIHDGNLFTSNINVPQVNNRTDLTFIRDVGILNSNKSDKHVNYFSELSKVSGEYNSFIENNKNIFPYINNFKIESFFIETPLISYNLSEDRGVRVLKKIISKNEPNYPVETNVTVEEITQKLNIQNEENFDFVLLNYYPLRKSINDLLNSVKEEKKKQEEITNKRLNKLIEGELGFNPTIQEVFDVIIGNVDVFLSVLYDYAYRADLLGEERTADLNIANTDIPQNTNRIYPFPAVINENGENTWIGDIVGENNANFPEIELVNKTIENIAYISNLSKKNKAQDSILQRLKNQNDDWLPINPIDYTNNEYFNINNINFQGTSVPDELSQTILKRLIIAYNYSRLGVNLNLGESNLKQINLLAELEGAYAEHKIIDEKVENIIYNFNTDDFVDGVIQSALDSNFIFEDTNGISLFSPTLNGYNFENSLGFFISEEEPAIYQNISNNNIQEFAENLQKIINDKKGNFENIIVNNKNYHADLHPRNYYVEKDITDLVWSKEIQNRLKVFYKEATGQNLVSDKPTEATVLQYVSTVIPFEGIRYGEIQTENDLFLLNQHNNIGRNLTELEYSTFNSVWDNDYYQNANTYGKMLLLLKTFNFQQPSVLFDAIEDRACLTKVPKLYLLWIGANFYRDRIFSTSNEDIIDTSYVKFVTGSYLGGRDTDVIFFTTPANFDNYSDEVKLFFEEYFIKWVDENFETFENVVTSYRTNGLLNLTVDDPLLPEYKRDTVDLLEYIIDVVDFVTLSPKKILNENVRLDVYPNITRSILREQLKVWHNTFKRYVDFTKQNPQPESDFQNSPIKDKDFKIRVYNDFKEIFDKWIAYGGRDGKIYNNCGFVTPKKINGKVRDKRLIDHFHFIDRTWSYIGDRAVINPKSLLILSDTPDINILSYISRILSQSKFNFHVMPSYVNYYSLEEVNQMFEPQLTIDNVNAGPTFVCMYVGGNSKVLDLGNQFYVNDGFDLREPTKQDVPNGFTNRRIPAKFENLPEESGKYNMAAFRVSYADQNQNIFKSVQVSQEEHRNTGEFLQIMSDLFDNRGGTQRFYKGTDLYNLYAVRSYAATVESMGNMQIQPLQYFQLDNIPMFHGAYMISDVNHRITANNVQTTFKGYRMPKFTYPIVDVITSYINLPLNEVLSSDIFENNVIFENYGVASVGVDNSQLAPELVDEVETSDRILFDFGDTEFRLLPNLTEQILNANLNRVFTNNVINTYGLGKYRCYSWVKNVLADLGVVQVPAFGIDAWDFFSNLGEANMNYIDYTKTNNFSNQDLKLAGVKNGSFVFGFYENSPYRQDAFKAINSNSNFIRLAELTRLRRSVLPKNITFNPVTHVGFFYNDQFYHLLNGVTQHPTPSFYPVAYYEFLPKLKQLSRLPA